MLRKYIRHIYSQLNRNWVLLPSHYKRWLLLRWIRCWGNWQESKEDENDSGRCSPYQYTWYIISFFFNSWTGLWLWNSQILFLVVFATLCKYWLTIKINWEQLQHGQLTSSFFFKNLIQIPAPGQAQKLFLKPELNINVLFENIPRKDIKMLTVQETENKTSIFVFLVWKQLNSPTLSVLFFARVFSTCL